MGISLLTAYDVRGGPQMSPTGRSYNNAGYTTNPYGGYSAMPHSADYSQGKITPSCLLL